MPVSSNEIIIAVGRFMEEYPDELVLENGGKVAGWTLLDQHHVALAILFNLP